MFEGLDCRTDELLAPPSGFMEAHLLSPVRNDTARERVVSFTYSLGRDAHPTGANSTAVLTAFRCLRPRSRPPGPAPRRRRRAPGRQQRRRCWPYRPRPTAGFERIREVGRDRRVERVVGEELLLVGLAAVHRLVSQIGHHPPASSRSRAGRRVHLPSLIHSGVTSWISTESVTRCRCSPRGSCRVPGGTPNSRSVSQPAACACIPQRSMNSPHSRCVSRHSSGRRPRHGTTPGERLARPRDHSRTVGGIEEAIEPRSTRTVSEHLSVISSEIAVPTQSRRTPFVRIPPALPLAARPRKSLENQRPRACRGVAQSGSASGFGTRGSLVRIRPPRPSSPWIRARDVDPPASSALPRIRASPASRGPSSGRWSSIRRARARPSR